MRNFLVVLLMIAFGIGSAFAQPQRLSPEERLKRDIDQLTQACSLTPEQVSKITPLVKEANEKQMAMFQKMRESGGQPDRQKMQEERNKISSELDAKIGAVISKQQMIKLQAFRKEQEEQRRQRMQNRQ